MRIPPTREYVPNGWSGAPEWSVYEITEELVKRGVDVTLFASGNSETSAKLESIHPVDSYSDPMIGLKGHVGYEIKLISRAYELAQKGEFDIIHSHIPTRSARFSELARIPTVTTLHSPLDTDEGGILKNMKNSQYYVSISNAQREAAPDLNFVATIHHGVKVGEMPFRENKERYLIHVGRIQPEKGLDHAIKITKRAGRKLLILGSPVSEEDCFWREKIKPFLDSDNVVYKGFKNRGVVLEYLKNAAALIFPLQGEESFGTIMIESMACGTPVIAYSRGPVPEVVRDGETGFVIQETGDKEEDLESMVRAVNNLNSIDPSKCRSHVVENFSIENEARNYLSLYKRLIYISCK
jgi:glycosyltransferase involved in cell wall biosynthesis